MSLLWGGDMRALYIDRGYAGDTAMYRCTPTSEQAHATHYMLHLSNRVAGTALGACVP